MDVLIIGAGAAGLTAAITAARNRNHVTVIEKSSKPGNKLLVTGNGRCNLTNEHLSGECYYESGWFVEQVLSKFDLNDTLDFFESIGIYTTNINGYIYPKSLQASTVVNKLRECALNYGVKIKTSNEIKDVYKKDNKYIVDVGVKISGDKLIIATGGIAAPKTGSDDSGFALAKSFGHQITDLSPALCGIIVENNVLSKASGVRVKGSISISRNGHILGCDSGELQITNYGISGIPAFNISHYAKKDDLIHIDLAPEWNKEQLKNKIEKLHMNNSWMNIKDILNGLFNDKLVEAVLQIKQINAAKNPNQVNLEELVETIKGITLKVKTLRDFEHAQVTKGGVKCDEINPYTMESKLVKDLYFAGEIINVDGKCGGYNLQFAWSSGAIAGGYSL